MGAQGQKGKESRQAMDSLVTNPLSRDGAASESQESVYELKTNVDGKSLVFAPGDSMINFGRSVKQYPQFRQSNRIEQYFVRMKQ